MKTLKPGATLHRSLSFERAAINDEARTVELAFSSEEPYSRWWGIEVLDHSPQSVRLGRLAKGGPLLMDHDTRDHVGVIESVQIGADRVGRAVVRFGKSARAEEVWQDVKDGIRRNVSVGYQIHHAQLVDKRGEDDDTYRVDDWEPFEVSLVAVPADATVGVGRAARMDGEESPVVELEERTAAEPQSAIPDGEGITAAEPTESTEQPQIKEHEMSEINVQEHEQRGADAVRKQVQEIIAIGEQYKATDLAAQCVREGKSVEEFKAALLERMSTKPTAADVPLSQKEAREYSYARAISAALDAAEGRDAKGLEAEVSEELRRQLPSSYKQRGGIMIPLSLQRSAIATSLYNTAGKGAEAVFTEAGDLIELLRNRSVAAELGARIMSGLQGPVSFPKQATANSAYWMPENDGTDVTLGNATLSSVGLTPKTLQASTAYSRQLLAQAIFDVEQFIRADLAAVHALAWDKAVLHGAGASNEPDGLYHLSGVNAVAMGGVPTFGKLVDMVTEVAKDNALAGSLAFVTTPGMAGKLSQTVIAASTDTRMIWGGSLTDGLVAGYRGVATNQVSAVLGGGSNEHGILFGNWEEIMIGLWGAMEIVVDPYALKKQGMVEITSFQLVDIAARHAESFCKATGATLS